MKTEASKPSRLLPNSVSRSATSTVSHPWLMLISRSVLFILFQALIALILAVAGARAAWDESARWGSGEISL